MGEPIFEIQTPDGKVYRLWADGKMEGFPDGTVISADLKPCEVTRPDGMITRFYDSRMERDFIRRRIVVSIENDQIGDGYFAPELAKTLHEIADLLDRGEAGKHGKEIYVGQRGSLAIITNEDVIGVCIPYPAGNTPSQAADPLQAKA